MYSCLTVLIMVGAVYNVLLGERYEAARGPEVLPLEGTCRRERVAAATMALQPHVWIKKST